MAVLVYLINQLSTVSITIYSSKIFNPEGFAVRAYFKELSKYLRILPLCFTMGAFILISFNIASLNTKKAEKIYFHAFMLNIITVMLIFIFKNNIFDLFMRNYSNSTYIYQNLVNYYNYFIISLLISITADFFVTMILAQGKILTYTIVQILKVLFLFTTLNFLFKTSLNKQLIFIYAQNASSILIIIYILFKKNLVLKIKASKFDYKTMVNIIFRSLPQFLVVLIPILFLNKAITTKLYLIEEKRIFMEYSLLSSMTLYVSILIPALYLFNTFVFSYNLSNFGLKTTKKYLLYILSSNLLLNGILILSFSIFSKKIMGERYFMVNIDKYRLLYLSSTFMTVISSIASAYLQAINVYKALLFAVLLLVLKASILICKSDYLIYAYSIIEISIGILALVMIYFEISNLSEDKNKKELKDLI